MHLLLLHYLGSVLASVAFLTFMALLLPNNLNALKIFIVSAGVSFVPLSRALFGGMLNVSYAPILLNIAILLFMCGFPIFIFGGHLFKRVVTIIFFMLLQGITEVISLVVFNLLYAHPDIALYGMMAWILHLAFSIGLYVLVGFGVVVVWKMIDMKKFQPFLLSLLLLPISQLSFLFIWYNYIPIVFAAIGFGIGLVTSLFLLVYVINIGKKAAIEEELRETRHAMALEQSHYRHVEERREELAKIRHDFNNQLAVIGRLLDAGDESNAQNMVATLAKEVMETKENVFCNIPVVNAILLEKSQVCDAEQIKLTTKLDLPPTIAMEQIHLCSIFGNLLDNAIRACRDAHVAPPPEILLVAQQEGDYLFIKMQNPSQKPPAKPAAGHGLGLRIVRDLAQQYGGDFHAEYKDGVFTAVVSVVV